MQLRDCIMMCTRHDMHHETPLQGMSYVACVGISCQLLAACTAVLR